jgi:hypothetical protein
MRTNYERLVGFAAATCCSRPGRCFGTCCLRPGRASGKPATLYLRSFHGESVGPWPHDKPAFSFQGFNPGAVEWILFCESRITIEESPVTEFASSLAPNRSTHVAEARPVAPRSNGRRWKAYADSIRYKTRGPPRRREYELQCRSHGILRANHTKLSVTPCKVISGPSC